MADATAPKMQDGQVAMVESTVVGELRFDHGNIAALLKEKCKSEGVNKTEDEMGKGKSMERKCKLAGLFSRGDRTTIPCLKQTVTPRYLRLQG